MGMCCTRQNRGTRLRRIVSNTLRAGKADAIILKYTNNAFYIIDYMIFFGGYKILTSGTIRPGRLRWMSVRQPIRGFKESLWPYFMLHPVS